MKGDVTIINIRKDGSKVDDLSKVVVPADIVQAVASIAEGRKHEKEKIEK